MAESQATSPAADNDLPVLAKDMARQMQIVDGRIAVNTLQDAYFLCRVLARSVECPLQKDLDVDQKSGRAP